MEERRPIPGYEGIYEASSLGRIRTSEGKKTWSTRFNCWRIWNQRILKPKVQTPAGRTRSDERVTLYKNGKQQTCLVARLVAMAFYGEHDRLTVNHIDGNSMNNRADNLEWVTSVENTRLGNEAGLMDWCKKSVDILNEETGVVLSFDSMSDASKFLGKFKGYIYQKVKRNQQLNPPFKLINISQRGGG